MIEALHVSKSFDDILAVDDVTLNIKEGQVFGMIGTNGAGKSTLLRMLAGIYRPTEGVIKVDGEFVYENPDVKNNIFYISDDQFYAPAFTPEDYVDFYASVYGRFDKARAIKLISDIGLNPKRKISTFSKGMKRQVALIAGICANTKYLFCDETFDGLDPVMRQAAKSLFAAEIAERGLTPVLASHNLRELEDICDYVGILHKGGVLLSKDLEDMKLSIHKIQCVAPDKEMLENVIGGLDLVKREDRGSLVTIVVRGDISQIRNELQAANPTFAEILPLTLEEMFVSETEVAGYDIKKLIL